MTHYTIGVDISKAHLDAHRLPDGEASQFTNDKRGFRNLIRWIGSLEVERIVYEPTGAYHRSFEEALSAAGLPIAKVNPLQARRFAQACGARAKTDKADARSLAAMGLALQPQLHTVPSEKLRDLKELHVVRQALIKDKTAAKNRQESLSLPLSKKQNSLRLRQIERDLTSVEDAMCALVADDPAMARTFDIICSIPGSATITALTLLAELPELGTLHSKQIAALAGLAPYNRDSGKWKGKRFIGGGRKHLRHALYMPALAASRCNPDLKAKYTQLIDAGKLKKVALTAIMRKLIILANALVKADRKWSDKMA